MSRPKWLANQVSRDRIETHMGEAWFFEGYPHVNARASSFFEITATNLYLSPVSYYVFG